MTKEQYLIFKSDLKKAIEIEKLRKRYRKAYWNNGFETAAAQENAIRENNERVKELTIRICASDYVVHWAYYCAKHQLADDQIDLYVAQEMSKMKFFKNKDNTWLFDYRLGKYSEIVKSVLSEYEKIVCTD